MRVLFVVSAARSMRLADGDEFASGYWDPEFALP